MNNTQTKGTTIETEHLTQQSVALDTMRRPRERRFEASRERASSSATPSTSGRTCVVSDTRAEDADAANDAAVELTARVRNLCARDASCSYVGDGRGSNDARGAGGGDGGRVDDDVGGVGRVPAVLSKGVRGKARAGG